MKTHLPALFFLLGLAASITISCKKDNTDNTPNPPSPSPGPGTTLSAVYVIDSTLPVPHDTIARYNVTFDALNRTTFVTELDTKPNGDSSYYMTQTYTYNGSDTNAARKIEYSKNFGTTTNSVYYDTSYFTYVNGKCTYDSSVNKTGYYVDKFAYTGNIVLRTGYDLAGGIRSTHQSNIYQTFVNGNITYQLDTLISHPVTVSNPALFHYQREEVTTSYISNPNPFRQVVKNFLRPYYYDDLGIGSGMAPKDLIAQQHSSLTIWGNGVSGNNIYDVTYSYTFRADGYPIYARQTFVQPGGTGKIKMYFVYK